MPTPPDALNRLRQEIDALDARLVALLNKRLEVSTRIGAIKREHRTHNSPFDPNREESLLRLLISGNPGPLSPASLRAIYREIFSSSRARQSPLTIGYLDRNAPHWGCEAHTSLLAARARFGAEENYRPAAGAASLLRETASGTLTLSLLCPGAVADHGPAIARSLYVCGEVEVPHRRAERKKKAAASDVEPLSFFLVTRREAEPVATPLLPGTRLLLLASGLGKATPSSAAALKRWCRSRRARLRFRSFDGTKALVDLAVAAGKASFPPLGQLEESLAAALPVPGRGQRGKNVRPRLHLLGAYLAEEAS